MGVCLATREGEIVFRDDGFAELVGTEASLRTVLGMDDGFVCEDSLSLIVRRDGRDLSVRIVHLDKPRDGAACVCILHDDSDSQRTKVQLRESLALLSSLVDSCPIAICTLDLDQKVTLWNPEAKHIFGWTQDEVMGKDYPLVPDREREEFEKLFRRVVVDGEGFTGVEVKRQRKDGSYVVLDVSTAPLRGSDGNITGALALLADLTTQRALEERVRHAQKMEAVGRLAGGVAHDFNNLLTVMLANSQLLSRQLADDENMMKSTRAIEHCAERARDLIQQLLTFSRRQVVNPTLLDVGDLARNTVRMLRRTLGEAFQLSTDLATDLSPVRADAGQVEQVLLNLIVNARDAMPSGGRITVGTKMVVRAGAGFRGSQDHFVCLSVADTGSGIDDEVLPHIFEPFFTTKRAGEGTGLGLATVYGIATRNGGTIEVNSRPGKGTEFRVLIPVAETIGATGDTARTPQQQGPAHEGTVLIVEDEALVLDAVSAMVHELGYEVTPVQSGREALARIATGHHVDLVLTDVYMPEMTGRVLADRLHEQHPELPVVYMSGNLNDQELRARVEAGEAKFLPKPLIFDDLAQALRDVIDTR